MTIAEFEATIETAVTAELAGDSTFDATLLHSKVTRIVRGAIEARKYPKSYSDDRKADDLNRNCFNTICEIVLDEYNHIGAEGETSHTENGITRHWSERGKIWNGILPMSKVL